MLYNYDIILTFNMLFTYFIIFMENKSYIYDMILNSDDI
jgi:hypothetical protein